MCIRSKYALILLIVILVQGILGCSKMSPLATRGILSGVIVVPPKQSCADGIGLPYYALVIGISAYSQKGWNQLPNAVKDAEDVEKMLRNVGFSVRTVRDPNSMILKQTIEEFVSSTCSDPERAILLYYAGHGYPLTVDGERKVYLVPSDAPHPKYDQQLFISKSLDMAEIGKMANFSLCRRSIWMFDSCFSGTIFDGLQTALVGEESRLVRVFITSGMDNQEVADRSAFKELFVQALENGYADNNKDGCVSGYDELGRYLSRQVENVTGGAQIPQTRKFPTSAERQDFVFALPRIQMPPLIDETMDDKDKRMWLHNHWIMVWIKAIRAREQLVVDQASGEAEFEKLLSYYRGDGMVYYQRGLAYSLVGRTNQALDDFHKAAFFMPGSGYKVHSQNEILLLQITRLLPEDQGTADKLLEGLISQQEASSFKARYLFLMGRTYLSHGLRKKANRYFDRALKYMDSAGCDAENLRPDEEAIIVASERMRRSVAAGESDFDALLAKYPCDAKIYLSRADAYSDHLVKQHIKAVEDVRKAEEIMLKERTIKAKRSAELAKSPI